MKKILLFFIALLGWISVSVAQEIRVKNFQKLDRDLTARTKPRLDLNDNPCALIKIQTTGKDFKFEGNVIGDPIYEKGEVQVYVTQRSRRLTIKHDKYGVLRYEFPEKIDKQVVYELSIKLIEDKNKKIRTLVMPVYSYGTSQSSYGLMIGVVRKTGAYLKVKTDFGSVSSDVEVNSDTPGYWYTGEKEKSRFSITAGVLQQCWKTYYVYGGLGYGSRNLGWKLADGQWAKIKDNSYKGLEAEIGGMARFDNVAVSAGLQTNQFKRLEVNIGVGIMF